MHLQPLNCLKHLSHLVSFGFSFMILYIYSWVALPGRSVHPVAAPSLTSLSKIEITHCAQITESDILWISHHLPKGFLNFVHVYIVSLLVSLSSIHVWGKGASIRPLCPGENLLSPAGLAP